MSKANTKPRTPQEQGYDFEEEFADLFGGSVTPGSGNQWFAKLDVEDLKVLWSLKHTTKESFRLSRDVLKEAIDAVDAPGGKGAGVLPGVAVQIGGEIFTIMRGNDMLSLITADEKYIRPSKSEQRRAASKIPKLLRDQDHDDE